ncbi:MAG: efflux RND transporter periplasmic adaptor subunit [Bacteroidales bacterium]|jgi:membrane fusion protein (multidrug efflux system)|nr:efflux RND transporter periplasmic adaptor subunit [Bacteroidales bacterium]
MNKKIKVIVISIIALLIVGMVVYPYIKPFFGNDDEGTQKGDKGKKGQNKILNVNAQVLDYESVEDIFRTKGVLIPDEEVQLSFETSGKITAIYFKEGSTVKKGDLLAKINDLPLQAELEKLETQLPLANDKVHRHKSLLEKEAISQEAYDVVVTELDKLNADIKLVKARIAQTELKAPFDGIIGLRDVSEGAYATPATIVAKLTKLSPLKIEFSVNESQAPYIKQGMPLYFYLDNDSVRYRASVYAVESRLDMQTLSLQVRALYPNSNGLLKPGHSATVELVLNQINNALVVPSQAVVAEMGRDIAFLYKDGKAMQVVLQKGLRTESSVQIISGLKTGDTLITTGVMQLRDEMDVTIDNISKN